MKTPSFTSRVSRHLRLTREAAAPVTDGTPPFLVLFINSICNLTCDHCFYWRDLNQRDDLSFDELEALSKDLGPIENLNLSGGEPFIRPDFAEIVRMFIRNNGVKQVYVPTNGYFTDKTEKALRSVLEEKDLFLFACELSLDGTPEYHNRFRGNKKSFENAMVTYEMMAGLQKEDPRLRIHSISTATNQNVDEIHALTDLLFERCPAMDHHNLAVIRGDRKDKSLLAPSLAEYKALEQHVRHRWHPREAQRFGSIVEPMLQWAKIETLKEERQVVPCRAGVIAGVVYANGDVGVCELHEPLGNLRDATFREIWHSPKAAKLRESIARKECWCTTEVFL
ncbi:MAG TPA: radical SAM protein, partial [Longimicrobiales bacterium]|nr:radical SAM protein [Longimicrobiales bacterium]